jgi:SAM-dependent methyltransferase
VDTEETKFYDHYSKDKPTRFGRWLVAGVTDRIFEFARIGQGFSLLEIGPGRGAFAEICLRKGVDYWAIEPNEEMADALEERGINVTKSIIPPVPPMKRKFDVVVMNSVMEHMDTMKAALEVSKGVLELLNPGGKFVVYVPDYANWRHHFFIGDFSHNYITTWRRMEGLLMSAGFDDIKARYQSLVFTGIPCYLMSAVASLLPFGLLDAMFPNSKLLHKLYKLQIAFLRRVLVVGVKQGPPIEDKT